MTQHGMSTDFPGLPAGYGDTVTVISPEQWASFRPVCLPCWRTEVSMDDPPPRAVNRVMETCSWCGRPTNHGIYLPEERV